MTRPVIELRNVSFSYQAAPVLEDVNLTIYDRESICIVGPNGGGKTTLLRLLLGQLRPTQGEILVFGKPPDEARLHIGYMPQRAEYDSMFPVTVMDVVLMGRLGRPGLGGWLGWYGRKDRAAAREALEQVHLGDAARRTFSALSGGQRQRVLDRAGALLPARTAAVGRAYGERRFARRGPALRRASPACRANGDRARVARPGLRHIAGAAGDLRQPPGGRPPGEPAYRPR